MKTLTVSNLLILTAALTVLSGCAKSIQPPFDWDVTGEFATPGTSLTVTELARARMGDKVFIYYEMKATGFASDEPLRMWSKTGHNYDRLSGSVDNNGLFKITGMGSPFGVMDFVPGQPLDIAIISETTNQYAQAKAFPYPVEAQGTNGCSIQMSLESPTGRLWFVTLQGFEPGQSIDIVSHYNGETKTHTAIASDTGEHRWFRRI